jgi:ComF family protein
LPDGGAHCYVCRQNPGYHFEYIRSVGTYEGILKDLIRKYKYQHRDYLDRLFGTMLADVVVSDPGLGSADVVVPVPIHWFKKVKRGYNQSELLANILAERLNKPLVKDMLSRTRYTRAQVRLKREERIANVQGCFTCHNTAVFHKKSVLVVDDVCTTAATLEECAKILRRAGASKVYGITLARD